eukprot:7389785-Prymnesium_polylepis.3
MQARRPAVSLGRAAHPIAICMSARARRTARRGVRSESGGPERRGGDRAKARRRSNRVAPGQTQTQRHATAGLAGGARGALAALSTSSSGVYSQIDHTPLAYTAVSQATRAPRAAPAAASTQQAHTRHERCPPTRRSHTDLYKGSKGQASAQITAAHRAREM